MCFGSCPCFYHPFHPPVPVWSLPIPSTSHSDHRISCLSLSFTVTSSPSWHVANTDNQSHSYETHLTSNHSFHHPTDHHHHHPCLNRSLYALPVAQRPRPPSYPLSWSHSATHLHCRRSHSCLLKVRHRPRCASNKTCSRGPSRRKKSGFHQLWPKYVLLRKCVIKLRSHDNSNNNNNNNNQQAWHTSNRSFWRTRQTQVYHHRRHSSVSRLARQEL